MTVAPPWPDHLLPLEEFDALPEDHTRRYELQDGVLIVAPLSGSLHSRAVFRVAQSLNEHLPADWDVLPGVEIVTRAAFPPGVRVPDVVVASADAVSANPPRLTAEDVLLAVEVVSPGTRTTDTLVKPVEYAEAGIPHYWVVDLDSPISLTTYHRGVKGAAVTGQFTTTEPFPLSIDVAALIYRREDNR